MTPGAWRLPLTLAGLLAVGCGGGAPAASSQAAANPAAAARGAQAVNPAAGSSVQAAPAPTPRPLVRVTVGEPVAGMTFLPFHVAQDKGFDRERGVEFEFQTIGGTPAVQAMVSGSLDFTVSAGATLNARLNGAPVVVLMVSVDKSTYSLYARPEIKSLADLKGTTVGVGAVGDSQHTELGLALAKLGYSLDDVRVVGLPGGSQLAAIEGGAIDAVVLTPPMDTQLEQVGKGYHRLLNMGDYVVGINGGLGAATALLQARPELVDAVVTASLMGLRYLHGNRDGTVATIASYLDVDRALAERLYDSNVRAYTDDGRSTPESRAEIVEHAVEVVKPAQAPRPEEPFDFAPLERAERALERDGWQPR